MNIQSDAFMYGDLIPRIYTCDGKNINPALTFSDIPAKAKSLALLCDDPDSPIGTWNHWSVWNINPSRDAIKSASVPAEAREGLTSFGVVGYGGPCPHDGRHRYIFTLYALDRELDLPAGATKEELLNSMKGYVIQQAELVGTYEREK